MLFLLFSLFPLCFCVIHVHLMDVVGQNMLFRGGSPEVKRVFSHSALVASLNLAAKASNTSLPERYALTVINVENLDTSHFGVSEDGTNVVSEYEFFANNTNVGTFLFWHMVGR